MSDFFKGVVTGVGVTLVLVIGFTAFRTAMERNTDYLQHMEEERAIQEMREDYSSRNADEFLLDTPGVRDAADSAIGEFRRKLDEAVQRSRGNNAD
jgi:hypothetical protein